jgi:hypothetical protein
MAWQGRWVARLRSSWLWLSAGHGAASGADFVNSAGDVGEHTLVGRVRGGKACEALRCKARSRRKFAEIEFKRQATQFERGRLRRAQIACLGRNAQFVAEMG